MTDFFALPKDTVQPPGAERMTPMPQRPSPYDNPDQVGQAMGGDETRLTVGEWNQRARVAQECADDLEAVVTRLNRVLRGNYLGDCPEGETTFNKIAGEVDAWRQSLTEHAQSLNEFEHFLRRAGMELSQADDANASNFQC